jgi:hypothetical protein
MLNFHLSYAVIKGNLLEILASEVESLLQLLSHRGIHTDDQHPVLFTAGP